ncbi:Raf kinase inhibitor-like YbhB/YbcL family protein [Phyllobacterium ifriqiyense]|uniref:Raf kinase inhibitor-like YbhB/YbcL family protein n=1 Tax=Phyllobacterium ifriqiyense TaxID=314238 RepID=A0ABU0S3L9_9HYPH|nr:YbhB/YbcL family Raf kinase inhibitor-like protein [Phyllobacterium ifriqiyense]MDQ0995356.1 Raf kinase inhibitor-like YbhB/YbcL family protein [Phyllobacterium ifriqiyense]
MKYYTHTAGLLLAATTFAGSGVAWAEVKGVVGRASDVVIQGSILEPEKLQVSDDAELTKLINVPDGFKVEVFARDLINPRMLAVSKAGHLYATRRSIGDVILLKDGDGDGKSDKPITVASRPGIHGVAFDDDKVFLVTIHDVYTAGVNADGSFGPLKRIISDLPDAGQHANRTIAVGPDDMLYISVGSTCNECQEDNPENATILRASKDGTKRSIFASGLRNTIGFDWEPGSGHLYGMDHGIDWLGDEVQIEEFNALEEGKRYGWPYVYGMSGLNPHIDPPEGITLEQWAKMSAEPTLGYTAHSAPMQMTFYNGKSFPAELRGDAFVAMRGSWNRRPPSGYEVVRVNFQNGKPVGFEKFLDGFLLQQANGKYGYLGRLSGLAVGKDGSLFVADDSNGIVYRVSHEGAVDSADSAVSVPDIAKKKPESKVAFDLINSAKNDAIMVKSAFNDGQPIPLAYALDGDNASPPLEWDSAPAGTKSFVLIVDDPDAMEPRPFTHWVAYDIPAKTKKLREGVPGSPVLAEPKAMKQGANSSGSIGYTGPKPPVDDPVHHYHFQVFALDVESLGIDPGANREKVMDAMEDHVLAAGRIVGTFER